MNLCTEVTPSNRNQACFVQLESCGSGRIVQLGAGVGKYTTNKSEVVVQLPTNHGNPTFVPPIMIAMDTNLKT